MAEAMVFLSALQAITQLVEQAFRIMGRLRTAHQRQKDLLDLLKRHESELNSIKAIIGIIDDEEELQTSAVAAELLRLQDVQKKLAKLLESLDPKAKSKTNQIARQLMYGSADEKKLGIIMGDLSQVKATLLLRVQLANVGVMRTMGKTLVANAEVIQRIDENLRQHVHECNGLRIARLLRDRRPSNDGTVPLTPADLRSLSNESDCDDSSDETLVDEEEPKRDSTAKVERIVLRNATRDQALQINAAIEKDLWRDIDRLVIKDNVAEGQTLQVNHAVTKDILMLFLDRQEQNILKSGQPLESKRLDRILSP